MKKNALILLLLVAILVLSESQVFGQLPWIKYPNNPVMSGGVNGTWNHHVWYPNVLYNADSARYEMWYTGSAGPQNNWMPHLLGYATSDNGISWTKRSGSVFGPDAGAWDEGIATGQTVIRENGTYKMWYVGGATDEDAGAIGYATSPDGIAWTKYLGNPVMVPSSKAWQAGGFFPCHVLPVEGGYKMWYTGWDADYSKANIGYATSPDGFTWTPDTLNNPVLTTGAAGKWDDAHLWEPRVLFINNYYHMWFLGKRLSGDPRQTGWATSSDGIHWNKYNDPNTTSGLYTDSDPVLKISPGQWDGDFVQPGTVMLEGDSLRMWYSGSIEYTPTNRWHIGHATAPFDSSIVEGIEDYYVSHIPEKYLLSQNYPNPFNPSTTIEFTLPKTEFVELKVYNILGKEVSTLVSKKLNPGNHSYTFDGKNLASGVYYYQLVAGDYREVKKMILLR